MNITIEVSKCPTCNGTDLSGKGRVDITEKGLGVAWSACPVCESGLVTQQGTIKRWCTTHDLWGYDTVCASGIIEQGATGDTASCELGLVLVVPLEEAT